MGISSLDSALSGLSIAQQQLSVISNNIANVGTPGYTRKILPQGTQDVNGIGIGVLGQTVIRNVDLNLERSLWTQTSAVSALNVKQSYLGAIQQFHGAPNSETSISAQISHLQDSFSALSDSPSDPNLQNQTVNEAIDTATKINNLSNLITTQRNNAQSEITTSVTRANELLDEIATLNAQVANATVTNRSTADAEDKRDTDINELSGLIDISFFKRSDNVVVVQTKQGEELASETARHLSFSPTPLGPTTAYPATVAGLYLGNPVTDPASVDLTTKDLGGKIGGLLELRDQIFPKEMAQTDELAHQLATRTAEQGLALFTDSSGNIPPDTAPNPTTSPPTPVPYVGFSAKIQVNPAILNDHTLLQKGTYGATLPTGSNQVIRRVIQFAFGDVDYQQAIGDIDIRVSTQGPPTTLQNFLGLHSTNEVDGVTDLSSFPDPATLIATTNGAIGPGKDTFRLTFQDSNLGLGPVNIDVPVGSIPNTGGDFTQDLISYINGTVIPALPAPQQAALTAMNVSFSESSTGQFVTKSNATITVDATNPPNAMGAAGLAFLGLAPGVTKATDPYFDVRVGNNASTRITIDSNDTEVDLQAKLATVPGLAMQDLVTSPDGFLRIRPGDIYTNPNFGGDITISSGPGTTLGATANVIVAPGTVPNGLNIVSALFGSFSTGPTQDLTPVKDVGYGSQTNASLTPPIPTLPFRTTLLGPSANISTNIPGADNLVDYAQQLVNEQTQQANDTKSQLTDATSLQSLLQDQLSGESGVNLDQEFGNLITVQNAYAASARVISTVSQMFTLLLNAVNA